MPILEPTLQTSHVNGHWSFSLLGLGINPVSFQVSRCVEDDVIFCLIDLLVLFNASDIDLENRSFCEETQVRKISVIPSKHVTPSDLKIFPAVKFQVEIFSIPTVEGVIPTLPLPPVKVQHGQSQEEVLRGSEGHLLLRRARIDGLKNESSNKKVKMF